jgi:hypothetical protein
VAGAAEVGVHPDGYFALVLTPASSKLLRARFATLPQAVAHHCTVRHGTRDPADLPAPFSPADLGATFRLQVTGFATRADGGVEAVVVSLILPDCTRLSGGFTHNRIAHVTVATDGETEPFEANALLEAGFTPVDGPTLEATLTHTPATPS